MGARMVQTPNLRRYDWRFRVNDLVEDCGEIYHKSAHQVFQVFSPRGEPKYPYTLHYLRIRQDTAQDGPGLAALSACGVHILVQRNTGHLRLLPKWSPTWTGPWPP